MSGSTTKRMLKAYMQMAQPTLFLSGLFQSPPENFHTSEEVEIDIVRSDEDISIVIQDLSTGYRMNSKTCIRIKVLSLLSIRKHYLLIRSTLLNVCPDKTRSSLRTLERTLFYVCLMV